MVVDDSFKYFQITTEPFQLLELEDQHDGSAKQLRWFPIYELIMQNFTIIETIMLIIGKINNLLPAFMNYALLHEFANYMNEGLHIMVVFNFDGIGELAKRSSYNLKVFLQNRLIFLQEISSNICLHRH